MKIKSTKEEKKTMKIQPIKKIKVRQIPGFKSKFDKFEDFRLAKKRKYPIKTIPFYPEGRLIIVPRKVIGKEKSDITDAGVIINKKKVPKSFIVRMSKDVRDKHEKRELLTHEIYHWRYKKFGLDNKFRKDKSVKKLMKINPLFRKDFEPIQETVVQAAEQARFDLEFRRELDKKFPNLSKKLRRYLR